MFADGMRLQKARQSVHDERDRLLARADKRIDVEQFMPSDGKDRARVISIAVPMAVFGMVPYVVMILMWFYVYKESFLLTMVAFTCLLVTGAIFSLGSKRKALGKTRPWMFWFGVIWMQAALVGLVVGFFLYFRQLIYFSKYEEMRTYTNVGAAQSSRAFGDGALILFSSDSRLDPQRAVGYKSRWTGQIHCVAPVVDVTMNQADDIHYWAVGVDCCTGRASFQCDDAGDFSTHSGLRVLEPDDVARPFMRWAVKGSSYPEYMEAVRLQEATYATKAAAQPMLIRWTRDPVALKNSFFYSARRACIKVSLVYFFIVAIATYFLAWKIIPRQKREGIIRQH